MLLRDAASFDVAVRLRSGEATLADAFTFMSGLYFRGKVAYSRAFAMAPNGCEGSLVITANEGLVSPDSGISVERLRRMSCVPIDCNEAAFRAPLIRDIDKLACSTSAPVILLGSIASPKYVEPLLEVLGDRLLFPAEFVGRGDMSRGGLMLRCSRSGDELEYIPVATAVRRGHRPARLPKLPPEQQARPTSS